MNKAFLKLFLVSIAVFFISTTSKAQCDTIANICAKHIISNFISDGQQYRSLLFNQDETAEFHTTFFGETTYRIAACSGLSDGNLVFYIYDNADKRNLLFTNSEFKNAPYWDFKVKSSLEVTIEAKLDGTAAHGSGCAVILIGFKQK